MTCQHCGHPDLAHGLMDARCEWCESCPGLHSLPRVLTEGPFAGKKIVIAARELVVVYAAEIDRILDAIGYPGALVTDESSLSDFSLEPLEYALAEEALGIQFEKDHERLVDIAQRLHGKPT